MAEAARKNSYVDPESPRADELKAANVTWAPIQYKDDILSV